MIDWPNKIFNIRGGEWPRVLLAWAMRFFYRMSFVIAWMLIVSMFTVSYGITSLPYLFGINAFFTILGSLFYSVLIEKFSKEDIIYSTVFLSAVVLFIATRFFNTNQILFFSLLVVVEAIFMMQLKIIMDGYVEEMFDPLASERVFPFTEAAETIGGILAGLVIFTFSNTIETYKFVYVWIIGLLLIVPCILAYQHFYAEEKHHKKEKKEGLIDKIKNEIVSSKQVSFIKGLFLIVFLQWFLFNLMEFQYTKAIYNNVSGVILEGGSGFEHAFIHDLGVLFTLFSVSALVIQFFLGSRLINYLGVVGSMILHPIVTLLSLVGMLGSFNFYTAVFAKNNFVVTSVIHTNAYHSAYYAIKEKFREYTREFLEGIVRPLGAFVGTVCLIGLQYVVKDSEIVFFINLAMLVVALVLLYVEYQQQHKYTKVALKDLANTSAKEARLNSVDILSQNGHNAALPVLLSLLLDENEDLTIRKRILDNFSQVKDLSVVQTVIECLDSPKVDIKEKALDTLISYEHLSKSSKSILFLKYKLMEFLKDLYKKDRNHEIRSRIIFLISKLSSVSAVEFLLNVLKEAKGELKADVIHALGNFDDYQVVAFVRPYLKSKDIKCQINAAIVLAKLKKYHEEGLSTILSFIYSDDPMKIENGLYALGELKMKSKKKIFLEYLDSENIDFKLQSIFALLKMNYTKAIFALIDLINKNKNDSRLSHKIRSLMRNVDVRIRRNIDKMLENYFHKNIK